MRHLFLSTVAAIAIAAAPTMTFAQGVGGADMGGQTGGQTSGQKETPGGGDRGGGGARTHGAESGGGATTGREGGGGTGGSAQRQMDSGAGSGQDTGGEKSKSGAASPEMKSGGGVDEKSKSHAEGTDEKPGHRGDRDLKSGDDRDLKSGGDRERAGDADRERDRGRAEADRDRGGGDRDKADATSKSHTTVNVTTEQKTRIKQTIVQAGGPKVARADLGGVSISVGARVPRQKIRIARVPTTIVQIVPQYAAYSYFVTEDGLIVIVDPDTYEIVYVL